MLWGSVLEDTIENGKAFAERYTLEQRKRKRHSLLEKCGRENEGEVTCVVIDQGRRNKIKEWTKPSYVYHLSQSRFAIGKDMPLIQLMTRLNKKLKLNSETGLFYYCKDKLLRADTMIRDLDCFASKEDGFLYLVAEKQEAYGGF